MKPIYVRMSLKMGPEDNPEQTCEAWLTAKITGFTLPEVKKSLVPMLGGDPWVLERVWEEE